MLISEIRCDNRLREDLGDITGLAESIKTFGIIQPIVIEENSLILVCGGRRLTAMKSLGWTDVEHGKHFIWRQEMSEDSRREAELEENVRRKDMDWRERVCSIAEIHSLRSRDAAKSREAWGMKETGELLGISIAQTSYACAIAKLVKAGNEFIIGAESFTEAIKILMKHKEDEATKLLSEKILAVKKSQPGLAANYIASLDDQSEESQTTSSQMESPMEEPIKTGGEASGPEIEIALSHMVLKGDSIQLMREALLPESVDHIITDPPYAIDMDMLEQQNTGMDISSVRAEHNVDQNLKQWAEFFPVAFRVLRDKGFLVFWYDLDHHEKLQNMAQQAGFKVQRWPLVWVKTHTCLNQSAQYNFTKATEVAMICRKGNATLIKPQPTNYLILENKEANVWKHPFAKPSGLWGWIFDAIAIKGQTILDPFAGVGSCPITALNCDLNIVAMEINDLHHAKLVEQVTRWYKTFIRGNIKFV